MVVGLGGIGGYFCEFIVRAGLGKIICCDRDFFQIQNMNRQLLAKKSTIGLSKAEVAKAHLENISDAKVIAIADMITTKNIAEYSISADIIVDCTDNYIARQQIASYCEQSNIVFVHGAIGGLSGQVSVIHPEKNYIKNIYKSMAMKISYTIAPVPAIVASLQATEVIKELTGVGTVMRDEIVLFDLASNDCMKYKL